LTESECANQQQETGTIFLPHGGMSIVAGPH
jgi:hypothetical protein